ncbi:MAG: hypothetical protein NKF70_11375 [Methanobacterium sp. ERen5]|nr:MAG: hypothetical protein NKF70_11375 [Methanobacterium sp. ERen5]
MDENKKRKKEIGDDMWSSAEEDMKERAPPDLLKKKIPNSIKKNTETLKLTLKIQVGKN